MQIHCCGIPKYKFQYGSNFKKFDKVGKTKILVSKRFMWRTRNSWENFLTAILHGLFFSCHIYFFHILFGLSFPFSIWTFISLFYLDFYFSFPFLFGLFFPFLFELLFPFLDQSRSYLGFLSSFI